MTDKSGNIYHFFSMKHLETCGSVMFILSSFSVACGYWQLETMLGSGTQDVTLARGYTIIRVFRNEPYSVRSGNFVQIRVIKLS